MAINWTVLTGAKTELGSIANWVNRSDVPVENILIEAESFIYQFLRVREMRTRNASFTFSSGSQSQALPTDYLDPIQYKPILLSDPLLYVNEENLDEQRDIDGAVMSGTPSRWTVIGDPATAWLDCNCDQDVVGVLLYYARPAPLSADNLTNFLTTKFPSLLRYACMAKAYEHMKDTERAATWLQLANGALADAMRSDDLSRRGQYIPA